MLVFFIKLGHIELQVQYFALFLLFSVIRGFKWFWTRSLRNNIQLMLEFLKTPFFVTHFSYYTLMTFLMVLYVILVSIPMKLLFILSVIRHLICGNNLDWLLNFNVIYKIVWTGARSGLLIFHCWENSTGLFDQSNNTGSIDVKMDRSVLEENDLSGCSG